MIDPVFYGCENKLNYETLLNALDKSYVLLSNDSGKLKIDNSILGTTDTVYKFCEDDYLFIESSYFHCANDIFISKAVPVDVFLNISFSINYDIKRVNNFFKKIKVFLKNQNINLVNAHSYISEIPSISWTILGEKSDNVPIIDPSQEYDILQIKQIGTAYLLQNINNFELAEQRESIYKELSLNVGKEILKIKEKIYEPSTDITGFGLYLTLNTIAKKLNRQIFLDINKISYNPVLEKILHLHGLSCSARQNKRFVGLDNLNELYEQILFGSEINGSIVLFIEPHDTNRIIDTLPSKFHPSKIGKLTNINDSNILLEK